MSEVQRYSCWGTDDFGNSYPALHDEDDEGEWVRYEDHAAALAAKDARIRDLDRRVKNQRRHLRELQKAHDLHCRAYRITLEQHALADAKETNE